MTPQAKRVEAEALAKAQSEADLVSVMSTPAGRRFVWRLLQGAGITAASIAADTHETAFNEGRRAFGLRLMAEVQALARTHYLTMMHEMLAGLALEEQAKHHVSETKPTE